jgi:hypothetical protein
MARCPYCHTVANPLRLLLYSGAMGYCCKKCTGCSRLPRWGFLPMAATLIAVVILGDFIVPIRVLWVGVGAVAAWLVMWLLLRLHPVKGGEPETPQERT